jgi:hypothetical protein
MTVSAFFVKLNPVLPLTTPVLAQNPVLGETAQVVPVSSSNTVLDSLSVDCECSSRLLSVSHLPASPGYNTAVGWILPASSHKTSPGMIALAPWPRVPITSLFFVSTAYLIFRVALFLSEMRNSLVSAQLRRALPLHTHGVHVT